MFCNFGGVDMQRFIKKLGDIDDSVMRKVVEAIALVIEY